LSPIVIAWIAAETESKRVIECILEFFLEAVGEFFGDAILMGIFYLTGRMVTWLALVPVIVLGALFPARARAFARLPYSGKLVGGKTGPTLTAEGYAAVGLAAWIAVGIVFLVHLAISIHNRR